MIFTSVEFVVFFTVVLLVRSRLRSFTAEKWFLLVASYVFYMSWSIRCGFLILFTSLIDFLVAWTLGRMDDSRYRKLLLAVSIVMNLGVLGFFKYTNFLIGTTALGLTWLGIGLTPAHYDIVLPVGLSFFTFASMSYTIEVYRRTIPPCRRIDDVLLFVAFFPQLVAGPIVRAADFLPQLAHRVRATALDIEMGFAQFAVGAVKKIVISDQIAPHVDLIFAAPGNYDAVTLLQGVLGYATQIYCDFSGYSDMAIGVARMMGFRFMENFQMPYSATTITEFWRRWHISLSTWLRDYLYVPLGGNRKGTARTYVNLIITMLLGGLWHGASWNFVFWGGLHGVCLAIHKAWMAFHPFASWNAPRPFRTAWSLCARLLTLGVVLFGWIFFRAESWAAAIQYVTRLMSWTNTGTRVLSPQILLAVAAVILAHMMVQKDRLWSEEVADRAIPLRIVAYSCLALLLACLAATDAAPFIYFQF